MENKYCIYCATENGKKAKVCKKCGKKLKDKPHEFLKYLKSKIREDLIQNTEDKFWSILINFIKSHLYGVVVSLSVIFTTTSLIATSISNNYIENVTEKPEFEPKYAYVGEGLEPNELCEKYVNAILSDDIETVKGLQLENFYPQIYKEFVNYYNDEMQKGTAIYNLPHIFHDLVANAKIYTSHPDPTGFYGKFRIDIDKDIGVEIENGDVIKTTGIYEKYNVDCLNFTAYYYNDGNYTYYNYDAEVRDEIEFVEIDGNYYIIGEGPFYYWTSVRTLAMREYMIKNSNGDMSQIEPYDTIFRKNGFLTDEDIDNVFNMDYWRAYTKDGTPLYEFYGYGV